MNQAQGMPSKAEPDPRTTTPQSARLTSDMLLDAVRYRRRVWLWSHSAVLVLILVMFGRAVAWYAT